MRFVISRIDSRSASTYLVCPDQYDAVVDGPCKDYEDERWARTYLDRSLYLIHENKGFEARRLKGEPRELRRENETPGAKWPLARTCLRHVRPLDMFCILLSSNIFVLQNQGDGRI